MRNIEANVWIQNPVLTEIKKNVEKNSLQTMNLN